MLPQAMPHSCRFGRPDNRLLGLKYQLLFNRCIRIDLGFLSFDGYDQTVAAMIVDAGVILTVGQFGVGINNRALSIVLERRNT